MTISALVACETSGRVRNALLAIGIDAWSIDTLPSEDNSNRHMIGDVRGQLHAGWNMLFVAHPPCTRLCNSGVRWLTKAPKNRQPSYPEAYTDWNEEQRLEWLWSDLDRGAALFSDCWNAQIEMVAVENPVMHKHAKARISNYQKPAQTVQPWWFGEPAFKATSFYLKGLPPLVATNKLTPPKKGTQAHKDWSSIHRASPGVDRWKIRSRTFQGVADAIADQWGRHALQQ